MRYDIAVRGDSVSLDDVNWVYPTLPRTGGGTVDLAIKNDPADLHVVDFRLQNMDMRTTGSHLTGEMWFGTGAPELLIRHVNLKADPVSFDFIRTLNGKPFPYDWRGDIFGTVRARGGTQRHFVVDDARGTFQDAHVRGAVSRFAGNGELDILQPAFTTFRHFNVDAQAIDLRTIEFLNKNFPRLGGIVYGTATLDSVWLDVRFSNASLFHQDGPGEPSQVTGSGRGTTAAVMEYDLTLDAQPLNATMLARSKPFEALPIRGLFSGPLRVRGTAPDLEIATTLQSAAGSFSFEGRADIDSIGGYGAHGRGQFSALNIAGLLEKPSMSTIGPLSGHYDVDVDSILVSPSSARGVADVSIDRTVIDSIRVHPSRVRVRFAEGKLLVDSGFVRTDAFVIDSMRGGIGLPGGTPDSLHFAVRIDSLGGLRPLLPQPVPAPGQTVAQPDSLDGTAKIWGVASGTFDALTLSAHVSGQKLVYNKNHLDTLWANVDLHNALSSETRSGSIEAGTDSITLAGIALDTIQGTLTFLDSPHRQFAIRALSRNGPTAVAGGRWTDSAATQFVFVDSLRLAVGDDRWRLTAPARVVIDSNAVRMDSLLIRNLDSAFIALAANVPSAGPAFAQMQARGIPLAEVRTIAQLSDTLVGTANMSVVATGTRERPVISGNLRVNSLQYGKDFKIDSVTATGGYDRRRVVAEANAVRNGIGAFNAHVSWPFEVTLFSAKQLNDSVDARISTPSIDLALITGLMKIPADSVKGTVSGFVAVSGTTAAQVYTDSIRIAIGEAFVMGAGMMFVGINGTIDGALAASGRDSTNIAIALRTNGRDSASITGWVADLAELNKSNTKFDLRLDADSLHAFNRRTIAEVFFSTPEPLRLQGTIGAPVLTGQINIDRGAIFLSDPDLARKLAVETLAGLADADSTKISTSAVFAKFMSNLVIQGVPVTLGEDVRLRSTEADVRLAGRLDLIKSNTSTRTITPNGEFVPGLSLTGTLTTTGGTYTLKFPGVQREFAVLPNGNVTFDGTSPETPLVDIKAQYTVKRLRDRDLNVIVNLTGRMPSPQLSFTSDNEYALEQSDLLSYLIIGQPGFDLTNLNLASVLSPTLSAYVGGLLRNSAIGSHVGTFQLQLGGYENQPNGTGLQQGFNQALRSSSLDVGVPVYKNVFVGLNAGYCQIGRAFQGQLGGLGVRLEYRFRPDISLQGAYDPAVVDTRANCNTQSFLGLVPSVGQFSFSVH